MAGDPQAQQSGPDAERIADAARAELDLEPEAPAPPDGVKRPRNQSPPADGDGAPPATSPDRAPE